MTVAAADLRAAFPEFGDTTAYPDTQINFWLGQAPNQLNQTRLGASFDLATMLFVAHNIVLSGRASTGGPGTVGNASGVIQSKSVGGVSASYDSRLTATEGAGYWNATSYGQRLWGLLKAVSVGPTYFPSLRAAYPFYR